MNKLSKEKRNQLILVALGTVIVAALIYIFLISPQDKRLVQIKQDKLAADQQLSLYSKTISDSSNSATLLVQTANSLSEAEKDMASASGDNYIWIYNLISQFNKGYNVDIPSIGQPAVSPMDALPHFPYNDQVTVQVSGDAYYHDFGKFIADFENKYPHIRVLNLVLEPAGTGDEKLNFRMDIVALIKPNS